MGLAAPPGSISPRRKPVSQESMLVVSAHAPDFAWRAGKSLDEIKTPRRGEAYMRMFPQVTDGLS
jgi:hypothetical protein